jgi:superfamily II DNA or RNA helicase
MGCKTLYLVHRKTLLNQVAREVEKFTGIKCGKLGSGFSDIQEVTVAMIQSLPKPTKKNKPFYDQWKLMIMDECQHGGANTWYKIAMIMKAKFKVALSGTPWTGKDDKDLRLVSVFGPNILINIKNKYLIKKGWSARPTINLWPVPAPENAWSWRDAYNRMIIDSPAYNESIIQIVKQQYENGKPTFVLTWQKRHASRIYKRLLGEEIDCVYLSSENQDDYVERCLERFKRGRLSCIVATPIFDEGIDVPAIRSLVLAGGGKAPIALLQRVGRALRKKPDGENTTEVHDFIHYGNYHLLDHSNLRVGIYEEEGFDIRWHSQTPQGDG